MRKGLLDWLRCYGLVGGPLPIDMREFPEALFPLECLACGYNLTGLTRCRCPECGTFFRRERLLLQNYVWGRRFGNRIWRQLSWMMFALTMLCAWVLARILINGGPNWETTAMVAVGFTLIPMVLLTICCVLHDLQAPSPTLRKLVRRKARHARRISKFVLLQETAVHP